MRFGGERGKEVGRERERERARGSKREGLRQSDRDGGRKGEGGRESPCMDISDSVGRERRQAARGRGYS